MSGYLSEHVEENGDRDHFPNDQRKEAKDIRKALVVLLKCKHGQNQDIR